MKNIYLSRTFIQTINFTRNWAELGLTDETLRQLEIEILENPTAFPVMKGTGGLRKARVALPGKGKSGGARVCFVDFTTHQVIYLITIYPKNEKDNLSADECNIIKKLIHTLEQELKKRDESNEKSI